MTAHTSHRSPHILLVVLALTIGLATPGCDRKQSTQAPEPDQPPLESTTTNEKPPVDQDSLSGNVEPGSLKVEDIGPPAPTVFFLANLSGYTEPCGCTADILLGGIDRITQYVLDARKIQPASIMIDAGDIFFEHAELEDTLVPQERAKTSVLTEAYRTMQVAFTVPGERDFAQGTTFYLEKIKEAGLKTIAANLTIDGQTLPTTHTQTLAWPSGDLQTLFIGAVDPALYQDIENVKTTPAASAIKQALTNQKTPADATILVFHGELGPAKELLREFPQIDFVIIGHGPRETDQVDQVDNGFTLEAYDQGRYVGALKLYNTDKERPYQNARTGSQAELETIDRQIEHVQESIAKIPAKPDGSEPPLVARLRERYADLNTQKATIQNAELTIPTDQRAFYYRPIDMKPGYALNPDLKNKREAYNASLKELNMQVEREPLPVAEGQPFFIGTAQCQTCHTQAYDLWTTTQHSKAVATLEVRDKTFDQTCIGCHVVGWEEPGGSVLGKLTYEAELNGQTFTKDLQNVGCESCHGPGSEHRLAPLDTTGTPQHILRQPTAQQCTTCHVAEHSPAFDFDTYVKRITGPGHQLK